MPNLMGISFIKWKPLFNILFIFSVFSAASSDAGSDQSILLQFKSCVSDSSGLLASWNPDSKANHCYWHGVTCDLNSRVSSLVISGREGNSTSFCPNVSQISIHSFKFRINCSENGAKLVGKLCPVISMLAELKVLDLSFNALTGVIPDEIWAMEMLEVLDLEGNSISASLPHQINGLARLRVLNLGVNKIFGEVPFSFSKLLNLEVLNLASNQLNGSFPGFLTELQKLRELYLSFNLLHGSIKMGSSCANLEHLDLSGNSFMNRIPNSLGNCTNLKSLRMYSNLLYESIPTELGRLKELQVLDLSRNSLSGPIPPQLGYCSKLAVLVLSILFAPSSPSNSFDDEFNCFQGSIPAEITSLPKIKVLWAPRATLDGTLPSDWGSCKNLEMVNLGQNFFHGQIPQPLSLCKNLRYLDLSWNRLSGQLGNYLPIPCIKLFDVSGNLLTGSIPDFSHITCKSEPGAVYSGNDLVAAYLSFFKHGTGTQTPYSDGISFFHKFDSNSFTDLGLWPIARSSIGYSLSVAANNLTFELSPNWFAGCTLVNKLLLNVSDNRISGQLPHDFDVICASLKVFDASRNQISGVIPDSMAGLTHLVVLNLSSNALHGQIPADFGPSNTLKSLSLSDNNLSGSIPPTIAEIRSLQLLELSSNAISGEIPLQISNLANLTTLLLNHNNLTGPIPPRFAKLTSFNASYNRLSGSIPNHLKCSSLISNPSLHPPCRKWLISPSPLSTYRPDNNNIDSVSSEPSRQNSCGLSSIVVATIASVSAIVAVLIALVLLFIYTQKWKPLGLRSSSLSSSSRKELTLFSDIGVSLTFDTVVRATGSFNASNCIGNGGFGSTYKAEISPGILVAIKRLAVGRFHGFQQFHAEIKTLGRLRHPNLVTLLGYHASESEMFLVYNYLPGGNLEQFIRERDDRRAVDWRVLHKIALDIARALSYLHDQCVPRVLHRDVKPSNILLDEDLTAYLSDFGLARLLGASETHATTGVAGTFGYVAPEYAMTCRVSDKADVYSYGVVLLELLSNKKALDPSFSKFGNGFNIVGWASLLLNEKRAREFFVKGLWEVGPREEMVEVLCMAVVCTVESLAARPSMRQVVRRLKQLQPPAC